MSFIMDFSQLSIADSLKAISTTLQKWLSKETNHSQAVLEDKQRYVMETSRFV